MEQINGENQYKSQNRKSAINLNPYSENQHKPIARGEEHKLINHNPTYQ